MSISIYIHIGRHSQSMSFKYYFVNCAASSLTKSATRCWKCLIMNPRKKVKNVRGEQDTKYIMPHSVPPYGFSKEKMMRWDLGRPSRIGREQCKEIISHWLPKPLSNTLAGVTVSRSSSVLAEAEINGNDAAKIWKQADQPINIAWWLQKNTTNRFWGSWANGLQHSRIVCLEGCLSFRLLPSNLPSSNSNM